MIKKILVALYLGFLTTLAYATIYSYVDNNGTTYYTNERPLGLTIAERAQFSSVSTTLIDAMTVNANVILSDRERVKGILRLDNTPPPVVVEPIPEPTPVEPISLLSDKVQCGSEWGWCGFNSSDEVTRQVWFGGASGLSLPKTVTGWGTNCGRSHFEGSADLAETNCYILGNPPVEPEPTPVPAPVEPEVPPPHHHGTMPNIDETKNPAPAIGFSDSRIRLNSHQPPSSQGGGDFRIQCDYSHTGVYDPLVYPGQARAGHSHDFFGNTGTRGDSTISSLMTSGNSTCKGGIENRSAYWAPSLIDTITNAIIKPTFALFYYKNGDIEVPNGLVILAGDMHASPSNPQATGWSPEVVRWGCGVYTGRQNHIPACNSTLELMLQFPTCWDGVNLDSPDHKSHVVYSDGGSCPSTHPKKIPNITYNIHYPVPNGTSQLRLASDNYVGGAGGYSAHGDYMFAWNGETLTKWFNNCIKARRDCHANLLGNGTELY
jgi:hypothetical protein